MTDNVRSYAGFKWIRSLTGATPPSAIPCRVASGYSGSINGGSTIDINIGDPVRFVSTGTVAHAAGNEGASGGEDIYGIVVNVLPYWDGQRKVFGNRLPAGTAYGSLLERQSMVEVYPAYGHVWEIDVDENTTATTESGYYAFIGENCDHRFTTGSEPKTNCLLDISTHGTATAQWRIVNISGNVGNQDFSAVGVKLLVTCNEAQMAGLSIPTATGFGIGV
jgi:hypothetical protein